MTRNESNTSSLTPLLTPLIGSFSASQSDSIGRKYKTLMQGAVMGIVAWLRGEEPGLIEKSKNYEDVGQFGEYLIYYALTHGKIPGRYQPYKNLYLPHRNRTTEVDEVLLHEKGIWVFESKNYSGWIYGSEDQQKWTQVFKGGAKERFYNPIKQNRSHIKALAEYLDVSVENFRSYVVFSERCELKKVPEDTDEYKVFRRQHLMTRLRKDLSRREVVFDEETFDRLLARLEKANKTDELSEEHVSVVEGIKEGRVCPYCSGKLVVRHGKHGDFLGCENFPKCRYTAKIPG